MLLQAVYDARPQPSLVHDDHGWLVLLNGLYDPSHGLHGVVALVPLDRDDVAALPHGDDRAVGPEPRRVHADYDGCRQVLGPLALHRLVYRDGPNELVVRCVGKLTVHLDVRLAAVRAVLVDNLLVDLLVGPLDRPGVHDLVAPEVPLGVEALVEVPAVAARIGERQPEPVGRVLGEEPRRHRPDGVVDARRLVEHQHDARHVVHARVRVGVLRRPQPPFDAPVARAHAQVALDQLGKPLGWHQTGGAYLEPMAVEGHAEPLGDLRPRY